MGIKVVAISDQHGTWPAIPPCDLLLVAGDQCVDNVGGVVPARAHPETQWQWFREIWLKWRYTQPAKWCVVTWGNHDFCGERHRNSDNDRGPDGKRTTIACDRLVEVGGLKVYLTPWSNQFLNWAFMREPETLARYYEAIPPEVDILVSHQPPHGCGDGERYYDLQDGQAHHYGSMELRAAIERVRPRAVVCGHIHAGYGKYVCYGVPVYNVSVVNEAYDLVHPPTVVWNE